MNYMDFYSYVQIQPLMNLWPLRPAPISSGVVNVAVVHFFADGFLRAAGSQDISWIGASATFNF